MGLTRNYQNLDGNGNEYSQYETDDAVAHSTQSRFTPGEKEAGRLTVNYNAVNIATGFAIDKLKLVRYKCIDGVVTLLGLSTVYSNADSGMTTANAIITIDGSDIVITVTGIDGQVIRHTLYVQRISSQPLN